MLVSEIIVEATASQTWSRKGGKNVRKYRCTSGVRKGRVMASPASCNKPINIKKSLKLKTTKGRKGNIIKAVGSRTRRANPGAQRLTRLNKPRRPSRRGRKI